MFKDKNFVKPEEAEENVKSTPHSQIEKQKGEQLILYNELIRKDFDSEKWLVNLAEFTNIYKRFLYSHITLLILKETKQSNIDSLSNNLEELMNCVQETDLQFEYLLKFYDHCNLAIAQKRAYKDTEIKIKILVDSKIKDAIKDVISTAEKDMAAQLISLVSLFTALSFVIFGGISMLESLLQNAAKTGLGKLVLVGCIWMLCIGNLFVLFIRLVCKIVDKKIDLKSYQSRMNMMLICITIIVFAYLYTS